MNIKQHHLLFRVAKKASNWILARAEGDTLRLLSWGCNEGKGVQVILNARHARPYPGAGLHTTILATVVLTFHAAGAILKHGVSDVLQLY